MAQHVQYFKNVYIAILIFVLIFYTGWQSINLYESNLTNTSRRLLKNELSIRTDQLIQSINYRFSLLTGVKAFVSTNIDLYDVAPKEFEKKANNYLKTIYKNVPDVQSLTISPKGVYRYIFPNTKQNLNSIGWNLLAKTSFETRKKTLEAIDSGKISISAPYYLNDDEELKTIARLAIYQDESFWGLTTMELDLIFLLVEANLNNIENGLFQFSLRNQKGEIFYGSVKGFNDNPVIYKINLSDSQWEVAITTSKQWARLNVIPLFVINFLIASLISSFLYVFLTRKKSITDAVSKSIAIVKKDQEALEAVFQALPDLYFRASKDGTILDYRVSKSNDFYIASDKFLNLKMKDILPSDASRLFEEKIKKYFLTKQLQSFEYSLQMPTGKYEYEVRLTSFPDSDDLIIVIRDITERKKNEELIWYQANYDPLTNLPNRRMLHAKLNQEMIKSHRADKPLALLFIDLDRFKDVNDSLGHGVGDILLVEAAKRIRNCIRESDTVARFGGDEFTVILSELDDLFSIERIAEKIIKSLSKQFLLNNNLASISASIGISIYPNDSKKAGKLIKNADQAMYSAKDLGRGRFSYFTKSMQQMTQFRSVIINDMRKALAESQFQLYFQPIIDLTTHDINKAEALIRWNHPVVGLVSPSVFISIAEETGFIVEIGNWVFREAARQIKIFKENLGVDIQVSINKSPVQFQAINDHKKWLDYLRQIDLPGESIVIEITEGLLMKDNLNINKQLAQFRNLGVQVSLDDFGTGYSSLSYLKKFDIDFLKLDKSFIKNLTKNSEDMALSEAIVVMAHKLGLMVIAEGIETEQQKQLLTDIGCDYGQGFLVAKPLPADEFMSFLKNDELVT